MRNILFSLMIFSWVGIGCAQMEDMHHGEYQHKEKEKLLLSGELKDEVREVEVKAFQYGFSPDPIVVNKGEKLRLKMTSMDVTHGIWIKEYKINVTLPPKETKTIEFIVDKEGEFVLYCSVFCGPGHGHMHGKLIVR